MIELITLPRIRGCGYKITGGDRLRPECRLIPALRLCEFDSHHLHKLRRKMYTRSKKFRESKTRAKCKYCDSTKVHWADTEYGWLLFDKNGKRHNCKGK